MKKNVNKFYLSQSVDPNSQSITRFDCHAVTRRSSGKFVK